MNEPVLCTTYLEIQDKNRSTFSLLQHNSHSSGKVGMPTDSDQSEAAASAHAQNEC